MIAGVSRIVASSHIDDAALSLGGALSAWSGLALDARVVTLFAGSPELSLQGLGIEENLGAGLTELDDFPALRRAEDDRAMRQLGVTEYSQLHLLDAIYRTTADGAPLFTNWSDLFDLRLQPAQSTVAEAAQALLPFVRAVPSGNECHLFAPLGIGNHIDHRASRLACERVARTAGRAVKLRYYEDIPYVIGPGGAALRAVYLPPSSNGDVRFSLSQVDVDRWIASIKCYASQDADLFGPIPAWQNRIRERIYDPGGGATLRCWSSEALQALQKRP